MCQYVCFHDILVIDFVIMSSCLSRMWRRRETKLAVLVRIMVTMVMKNQTETEMRQSLQMLSTQHSDQKTAGWGSAPHLQSSIFHQAWRPREMAFAKKVEECGEREAV